LQITCRISLYKINLRGVITMPKRYTFDNATARIKEVKTAMRNTTDKRMYERYQCIYLLLSGETQKNIAMILNRGTDTIGAYVKDYCDFGISGLEMKHSSGRPSKLTAGQEQEVYKTVTEKTPADVGFPAEMNWTAPLVCTWIEKEFQVKYSNRGTNWLLQRLGFSHTRPTYTLAKADPDKQEEFRQEFDGLKKIDSRRN
jgi:transposase